MSIKLIRHTNVTNHFRAEAATKAKLEKVGEIKRLNAQIVALKR